jgi:predicted DNA-binding transcriptional regulator AlpA
MELEMQEQILSAKDVARLLNVNRNVVYYQVKSGSLPEPKMKMRVNKTGAHSYMWKRSELEASPYFKKASSAHQMSIQERTEELQKELNIKPEKDLSRHDSSIENLYEMVGDNELLRDAIEMRVDKLEQDVRMLQSIYELLKQKKEKKWWQI